MDDDPLTHMLQSKTTNCDAFDMKWSQIVHNSNIDMFILIIVEGKIGDYFTKFTEYIEIDTKQMMKKSSYLNSIHFDL